MKASERETLSPDRNLVLIMNKPIKAEPKKATQTPLRIPLKGFLDS